MKDSEPFSVRKGLKSFRYAFQGFRHLIIREHNFRIHLIAAFMVISLAVLFNLAALEWVAVLFCIGLVFTMEAINSAIEILCDEVTEEKRVTIQVIKDICAGAVLIAALISVVVGAIIFLPKFLNL